MMKEERRKEKEVGEWESKKEKESGALTVELRLFFPPTSTSTSGALSSSSHARAPLQRSRRDNSDRTFQ
jgi:hypothetical protein